MEESDEADGRSIPAEEESEASDVAGMIELERLPTAASVGLTSSDVQINRGMVLDSSQWPRDSHFYESSEEEFSPPAESPLSAPPAAGVSPTEDPSLHGLTGGSNSVLTGGSIHGLTGGSIHALTGGSIHGHPGGLTGGSIHALTGGLTGGLETPQHVRTLGSLGLP